MNVRTLFLSIFCILLPFPLLYTMQLSNRDKKLFNAAKTITRPDTQGFWAVPLRWHLYWGANANARDEHNMTPLHWAAQNGHGAGVEILLANGANPHAVDNNGFTPLLAAVHAHGLPFAQQQRVLELLLKAGAHPNFQAPDGQTALHFANNHKIIAFLINNGADPNMPDKDGRTPLYVHARNKPAFVLDALVQGGAHVATPKHGGATSLHAAAQSNNNKAVTYLLGKGATAHSTDNSGLTALHYAVQHNAQDAIKSVLEHDTQRIMPLIAAQTKQGQTVFHFLPEQNILAMLFYYALLHGTTDQEAVKTFLLCLKHMQATGGPQAYRHRCALLPAVLDDLDAAGLLQLLGDKNSKAYNMGRSVLAKRAANLQHILELRDTKGKTAFEKAQSQERLKWMQRVYNPDQITKDMAAFIAAAQKNDLLQLPDNNIFNMALKYQEKN